eukprot:SAG31_NODE_13_length_37961_cov_21.751307_41_plen_125_part_00
MLKLHFRNGTSLCTVDVSSAFKSVRRTERLESCVMQTHTRFLHFPEPSNSIVAPGVKNLTVLVTHLRNCIHMIRWVISNCKLQEHEPDLLDDVCTFLRRRLMSCFITCSCIVEGKLHSTQDTDF